MIEILVAAIVVAMIVLFIHVAFKWETHIFEPIGNWIERNAPEWIEKPLIGCPICMCPWWGTVIMFVADRAGIAGVRFDCLPVFLTVFVAGGINTFTVMAVRKYELNTAMLDEIELPDEQEK